MKKSLKKQTVWSLILALVTGTLLHFVYQWTGCLPLAGAFSAVNESTWEHLKLLFFPSFVLFLIEHARTGKEFTGLLSYRICGLLLGLLLITSGFYTYSGIIGKNFLPIDITLFVLAVLVTFLWSSKKYEHRDYIKTNSRFLVALLFLLLGLFILFTYCPPHIAFFLDPVTFRYGI